MLDFHPISFMLGMIAGANLGLLVISILISRNGGGGGMAA